MVITPLILRYFNEAIQFYPDTTDSADALPYSIARDRTLWYIYANNSRYIHTESTTSIETKTTCCADNQYEEHELYPPANGVLELEVRVIETINEVVSFRSYHGATKDIYFPYDLSLTEKQAISHAIASDPYFEQVPSPITKVYPARITDPMRLIVGSKLSNLKFSSRDGRKTAMFPKEWTGFPMEMFRSFMRVKDGTSKMHVYFDTAYLQNANESQELMAALEKVFNSHAALQLAKPELGNTLEFVPCGTLAPLLRPAARISTPAV